MGAFHVALALLAAVRGGEAIESKDVEVYFGCGCFWHMQHGFVTYEMSALGREAANVTARTAYAGGTRTGKDGLVCYHNARGIADYGSLGHAEVVSMSLPGSSFAKFAEKFWELCPRGMRQDPQDAGGEYRSVVGLPGGTQSSFFAALRQKAGTSVELVAGQGNEGDTLGTAQVFVYDTAAFPAHIAENYHQFHDDMMERYGSSYNSLRKEADHTGCPGDAGSSFLDQTVWQKLGG